MLNIIKGAYLGGFLAKQFFHQLSSRPLLPSFKNVAEVKHFLPGRVRLFIPFLKGNKQAQQDLISQLGRVKHIKEIEANTVSGSLLIQYDLEQVEPTLIIVAVLKILGLEKQIEQKRTPLILEKFQQIGQAFNRAVYENTNGLLDLRTTVSLSLVYLALKKIIVNKELATPGAFTLLWWACNTLDLAEKKI